MAPALRIPVNGMFKEGLIQIDLTSLPDRREVPGKDKGRKEKHPGWKFHRLHLLPVLLSEEIDQTHQERKDKTHRSLGESGQCHADVESINRMPSDIRRRFLVLLLPLVPLNKTEKSCSREKGQGRIDVGPGRKIGKFNTGRKDQAREEP